MTNTRALLLLGLALFAAALLPRVDAIGKVTVVSSAEFVFSSETSEHCLSTTATTTTEMCLQWDDTLQDAQFFFTADSVEISDLYAGEGNNATFYVGQMTVTDSLQTLGLSTLPSYVQSASTGAKWTGAIADAEDFYFLSLFATADVPKVWIGDSATAQYYLLDERILPLSVSNGGTSASEIEGAVMSLQLGSLALKNEISRFEFDVLPIEHGGTGATEIEGARNNLQLGSLAVEDVIDAVAFQGVGTIENGGTDASNIEDAAMNLQLGSLAFEDSLSAHDFPARFLDIHHGGLTDAVGPMFGRLAFEGVVYTEDLDMEFAIAMGGTQSSDIEGFSNNFYLGSLAREDDLLFNLLGPVSIEHGGTGASDIETAVQNLQLGSLAYLELIRTTQLADIIDIPSGGTGATEIEGALINFQLGSLAMQDYVDLSDLKEPLTIASGGTSASEIEGARNNLQLGSLAVDEMFELRSFYGTFPVEKGGLADDPFQSIQLGSLATEDFIGEHDLLLTFFDISQGGTAASDIEAAATNLQLGSLAFLDSLDFSDLQTAVPVADGGLSTATVEDALATLQVGRLAFEDSDPIESLLTVVNGGTSADNIEDAAINLGLGSLAFRDYIDVDDLVSIGTLSVRQGGTAGEDLEDTLSQLHLGALAFEELYDTLQSSVSITRQDGGYAGMEFLEELGGLAYEDVLFVDYDFLDVLPLSEGGTSTVDIVTAVQNFQLGSLSFDDLADSHLFVEGFSVSDGGLGASNLEDAAANLQLGSVAYLDGIDPLELLGTASVRMGGTGARDIEMAANYFQLGSLATLDVVDEFSISPDITWTTTQGGTQGTTLEDVRNNWQLGSLAVDDIIDPSLLRDFVMTVGYGGTSATNVEDARNNLYLGSLAVDDFATVHSLQMPYLPVSRGGFGDMREGAGDHTSHLGGLQLGSLAYADIIDLRLKQVVALDISSSGTSATNIEDARNNLQLGSLAVEDTLSLTYLGSTMQRTHGALADTTTGGMQLGALSEEDYLTDFMLTGTLPISLGGLGSSDDTQVALQLGAVAYEDEVDSYLLRLTAPLTIAQGGSGVVNIEDIAVSSLQLGSLAMYDSLTSSDFIDVLSVKQGAAVMADGTSALQVGRLAYEDYADLSELVAPMGDLSSPYGVGLLGNVEDNANALQLGSIAFDEIVTIREFDPNAVFTVKAGGTGANSITDFTGIVQLGAVSQEDLTSHMMAEIGLAISVGGSGETTAEAAAIAFQLGSIAYQDSISVFELATTGSDHSIQYGLLPSGMKTQSNSDGAETYLDPTSSGADDLQLGAMAFEDAVDLNFYLLDTLPIRNGGLEAEGSISDVTTNLQLGSLAEMDFDNVTRPGDIPHGGLGGTEMEGDRNNLQLGSLAVEDYVTIYEFDVEVPLRGGGSGTASINSPATFDVGRFAYEDSIFVKLEVPFTEIKKGGTSVSSISDIDQAFLLGSLAHEDSIDSSLIEDHTFVIATGGFSDSTGSIPAIDALQLGSLGVEDSMDIHSLGDVLIARDFGGLGERTIQDGRMSLQLGSLSTEDFFSVSDIFGTLPVDIGGTSGTTVEDLIGTLQLGALSTDDAISVYELSLQDLSVQMGGLGTSQAEETLSTLQLGSLAFEDLLHTSDVSITFDVRTGGIGEGGDVALSNMQLGSIAVDDVFDPAFAPLFVASVRQGGTSAANIEDARVNLQLGALAVLDTISSIDLDIISIQHGGLNAQTFEDELVNLQAGSLAVSDAIDSYLFSGNVPISKGGLSASTSNRRATIEDALVNLQLGSLAYEDDISSMFDLDVLVSMEDGGTGVDLPAGSVPFFSANILDPSVSNSSTLLGSTSWLSYWAVSEDDPSLGGSFGINSPTKDLDAAFVITSDSSYATTVSIVQTNDIQSSSEPVVLLTARFNGTSMDEYDWENGHVRYVAFNAKNIVDGTVFSVGAIRSEVGNAPGNLSVGFESAGADYAEWFRKADPTEEITAGEVVAILADGTVTKRRDAPAQHLFVVSATPTVVGGMPKPGDKSAHVMVGLLGQLRTKVMGPVKSGDLLVRSDRFDGVAVALSAQDAVADYQDFIGIAWEDAPESDGPSSVRAAIGLSKQHLMARFFEQQQARIAAVHERARQQESRLAEIKARINQILTQLPK